MNQALAQPVSEFRPSLLKQAAWTVVPLCLILAGTLINDPHPHLINPLTYLVFHAIVDVLIIAMAVSIFAVGWNTQDYSFQWNTRLLSCAALIIGLLTAGSLIYYPGMPGLLVPASFHLALYLWMTSKFVLVMALFGAIWRPNYPVASTGICRGLVMSSLAIVAAIYWLFLFHLDVLPALFIPGTGPTAFKITLNFVYIAIGLAAAYLLVRRSEQLEFRLAADLLAAICILVLAEISFMFFEVPTDSRRLLGQAYLVLAFAIIFRIVFMSGVREPIENIKRSRDALLESEAALRLSEKRLRDITLMLGEGLYVLDQEGRIVFINPEAERLLGWSAQEALGRDIGDLICIQKPDGIPLYLENDPVDALSRYGTFLHSDNEVFTRKDGSVFPVSVVTTPLMEQGMAVGSVTVFKDITARKQAEEELKRSRRRLRELTGFLQTIREEERVLIAREIHDQLGQVLTALKMDIAWVSRKLGGGQPLLVAKTEGIAAVVDRAIETVRTIVSGLRPNGLDDLGLAAAVELHVEEFEGRTGIACHMNLCEEDFGLDSARTTALFRILQESLNNVVKHAEATEVSIALRKRRELVILEIRDNGKGFKPQSIRRKKTFGVLGMKERVRAVGGKLKLRNMPGGGIKVSAHIPLAGSQQGEDSED